MKIPHYPIGRVVFGSEEAIKAAVKDYYDKNGIAYEACDFADCGHCAHDCQA